MATESVGTTLPEALATAMELTPAERFELGRWLHSCNRAGLDLDPDSVRASSADEIGMTMGTRAQGRAPWAAIESPV